MSHSDDTLIRLTGVGKCYPRLLQSSDRVRALWAALRGHPQRRVHVVLEGVDLTVQRGQSLGIIGENGAGKSTLLKTIAGVITPSSGTVQIQGRIAALLELGAGFHPEYSGRENIRISAALLGLSGRELQRKLPDIIEFADIGDYIDEPVKHYSSGMVVRLGFAVVTAIRPDLLITDEVLAVGDESFQKKCIRWMEEYLNGGGTLLLCSHSMFHIQKLCRRACWIQQGRIRRYGDAFDVTREYLAYHEDKNLPSTARETSTLYGSEYRVVRLWLQDDESAQELEVPMGGELTVRGHLHTPDDRPPVVMVGLVRSGNVPVYGVSSDMDGFVPQRLGPGRYGFEVRFPDLSLLPGRYTLRAHAMDPEGLRIFDTWERRFFVSGATRELGHCRLSHHWSANLNTIEADHREGVHA